MLVMAKAKLKNKKAQNTPSSLRSEPDGVYLLKLVLFIILGSLWLKFSTPIAITSSFSLHGFPMGFFIGVAFAMHDKFQLDRKIEYAILIIMTIVSLFLPVGIILWAQIGVLYFK